MTSVGLHHTLAVQAARRRSTEQNAPRPARVRFSVNTVGVGESRLEGNKAVSFEAYLLDEPTFSFGVTTLDRLSPGEMPMCTAVVLKYRRTSTGFYTAAEMGFVVDSAKDNIRLRFSLTWEATTLRSTAGSG